MKKNYLKLTLDLLMAIMFALLMSPRVLGLPFHEIAGLVLGVAVLTHILLNFRWAVNATKKIFNTMLPGKTRFSYLLNVLLLISMSGIIVTGILISKVVFPNLANQGNHSIRGLHQFFAYTMLGLLGLHVGIHWQWVKGVCKKLFKTKEGKFRKGTLITAILLIGILAGGIQWFSTTSSSSNSKINSSVQQGNNNGNFNNGYSSNSNSQATVQTNAETTTQMSSSGNQASNFQGNFKERPGGDFGGHGGGGSPFLVLLQYLGILAILVIPTYYLEKKILRKKRVAK